MRLIEENGVSVAELKRSALHALAERAWKQERPQLIATLDESNAPPELRFEKLREHDIQRGTAGPLFLWSFTFEGCREIIDTACKASGVPVDSFCGETGFPRLQEIARELIGFGDRRSTEGEPKTGPTDLEPTR